MPDQSYPENKPSSTFKEFGREEFLEYRFIRPPVGAKPKDEFCALRVVNARLSEALIGDGDILIYNCSRRVDDGDLVVAFTPDGLSVGFLLRADGFVILRYANQLHLDDVYEPKEVTIKGVVIRVERDLK